MTGLGLFDAYAAALGLAGVGVLFAPRRGVRRAATAVLLLLSGISAFAPSPYPLFAVTVLVAVLILGPVRDHYT